MLCTAKIFLLYYLIWICRKRKKLDVLEDIRILFCDIILLFTYKNQRYSKEMTRTSQSFEILIFFAHATVWCSLSSTFLSEWVKKCYLRLKSTFLSDCFWNYLVKDLCLLFSLFINEQKKNNFFF